MNSKMPIGIDDFKEVKEKYYFVDKSFFIKDIIDASSKVTLITRPRRFGKTLTMSMLKYYFEQENAQENKSLFTDLSIWKSGKKYIQEQGKYPVIFMSLKGTKAVDWDESYKLIRRLIQSEYMKHRYLLSSDNLEPEEKAYIKEIISLQAEPDAYKVSLGNLTAYLYRHYGIKPIVLIDEYDVPIQCGWENEYYNEVIFFMKEWLNYGLKSNSSLQFAVITGVLRISKESIFSDLNNVDVCSLMVEKYNDVFGFIRDEVEKIVKDFKAHNQLPEIKEWYDGYVFGGVEIYNPWSVVKYFDSKFIPQAYWVNTSGNSLMKQLLKSADAVQRKNLLSLLVDSSITVSIREGIIYTDMYQDRDALYTLLLTTGYLKIVEKKSTDGLTTLCRLAIPNREIRAVYRYEVLDQMRYGLAVSDLLMMMENLLDGNTEEFSETLNAYLLEVISVYDAANKESFYHGFMLGIVALLVPVYSVKSNRESGYGRFDLAIFPKDTSKNGVIMEFKTAESEQDLLNQAKKALVQIEEKSYLTEFKQNGIKNVQKYGIAFCGKKLTMVKG